MAEGFHNIFHEAVEEPCEGFLKLVERLSVRPGQPDKLHEDDDMYVQEGRYTADDDTVFLPIRGLSTSWRLRERVQWHHRLIVEVGLGEKTTEIELIHCQWLQPREWFVGEGLTEALVEVAETDYLSDEDFFRRTVSRIEELEAAGKLELRHD